MTPHELMVPCEKTFHLSGPILESKVFQRKGKKGEKRQNI